MDVELECDVCSQRMTVEGVGNMAGAELLMGQWYATHQHSEEERAAYRASYAQIANDDGEGV